GPGDPSPLPVQSKAVPEGRLASGAPLPAGTAIVRTALELRAGALRRREVTITCPPGTRVADLLRPSGAPLAVGYAPGTIVGHSRRATVRFEPATLPRPARVTVSVLCKRPAASGTILAPDARGAAAPTHRVVVDDALLLVRPDGRARGSVRRGQPIAVTGASGAWRRVVPADGARGWLRAAALERIR